MTNYTMIHGSTEYRRILVTAIDDAGTVVDPTVYGVEIAFTVDGASPVELDWQAATWVTVGSSYYAKILIGPDGGIDLADTDHHVYVRVNAALEYPYLFAGILVFI